MHNYEHAALLFGPKGAAGEGNALAEYCETLTHGALPREVKDNIIERCGDELNHILGNILDATRIAGFFISKDGAEEIIEGLRARIED